MEDDEHENIDTLFITTSSWWFQPIWKICLSNWSISPGFGLKFQKYSSCHHPDKIFQCHLLKHFSQLSLKYNHINCAGQVTTHLPSHLLIQSSKGSSQATREWTYHWMVGSHQFCISCPLDHWWITLLNAVARFFFVGFKRWLKICSWVIVYSILKTKGVGPPDMLCICQRRSKESAYKA